MAKAAVVDLTGALEHEQGALVRSPWIAGGKAPDNGTVVVVPAHPAAVMLGVVGSRLVKAFGRVELAATVLEPASQQGAGGMDELHQQTVSLLGFHAMPQDFTMLKWRSICELDWVTRRKFDLRKIEEIIRRHVKVLAGEAVASAIAIQLVQAPVFHGYTMSVFAELPGDADMAALRGALEGGVIKLTESTKDAPSNQSVTQEADISIAIREDAVTSNDTRGYWLWMAADNLKLTAREAVACAEELTPLRASAKMQ